MTEVFLMYIALVSHIIWGYTVITQKNGAVAQFVNFMVLQGCLDIGNGFSRGEAVAMIGSSEPIIVTEEECGR